MKKELLERDAKRDIAAEVLQSIRDIKAGWGRRIQAAAPVKVRARPPAEKLKRTRGSGNVFLDVGFPPGEADNLQLRAQLMSRIRDAARGMPQREAAKRFGVTQPRLNDLLRGRITKFSLDALVNMLSQAGMRVGLKVKKAA